MTNWRLIFCAIMAGAILPLAFAPYSYLPLVYLSLGGWYTTIRMVSRQSSATPYRQSFLLGFMFGLGWFSGVAWVFVTLVRFGGLPLPLAVLATVLFCAYLALYPALVALIFQRFLRRGILHPQQKTHSLLNPTIFASLFTLLEWLRGILLTGFPWLNIGYAHAVENSFMAWFSLSALAPWVGVLGITWMNVWLACVVAEIGLWQVERYASIPTSDRVPTNWAQAKLFLCFAMVVGAIGTLSAFPVRWTTPLGQPITVQMVQGNTPIHLKWDPEQYERRLQHYTQLIQDHATPRPHLILLPETALSRFDFPASQDFVANTINQGSALLIGGILLENQGAYNSVGLFEQNQPDQYYSKVHLVPFGEYPPMGFAWFAQQLSIPMADLRAGVAPQRALFLHELPFAVSICYENLFPAGFQAMALEAALLVNVSNTGWYGDSWAMPQHLQISHLRALEMQKPMAHSADTGISAFINAQGKIINRIEALTSGVITAEIQPMQGMTPYARTGDSWVLVGVVFIGLLGAFCQNRINLNRV